MRGSTGGFDHQPKDCPPGLKATWWSITKLTMDVNPNVTRTPSTMRQSENAITNPGNKEIKLNFLHDFNYNNSCDKKMLQHAPHHCYKFSQKRPCTFYVYDLSAYIVRWWSFKNTWTWRVLKISAANQIIMTNSLLEFEHACVIVN